MFLATFKEQMDFTQFDFTPIKQYQLDLKEKNKEKTVEEKKVIYDRIGD